MAPSAPSAPPAPLRRLARERPDQASRALPAGPQPVARCQLQAVPRTLLLTLAARAWGGQRFPALDCGDEQAARLLGCLDPARSLAPLADYVVRNVLWRTQVIRQNAQAFFALNPCSTGLNIGCGLADPFQWLDNGQNAWVDADLAEVMALRARLLPPSGPRQRTAEVDLRRTGWWQHLGLDAAAPRTPLLAVCEGVLMYLRPATVRSVLHEFATRAPAGSWLLADFISHLGVGHAGLVPGLAQTGAEFRWGAASLGEFTSPHPRLRLLEQRSVAELSGWPGLATEACLQPLWGPALYGVVTLAVVPEGPAAGLSPREAAATSTPRRGC